MNNRLTGIAFNYHGRGLQRLNLFFALSRTPHGLIDMTTPAFAALLWLGKFPPLWVTVVGLTAAFAGYTAVYALNDLIDYRSDREKYLSGGYGKGDSDPDSDLDSVLVRHPLAQGKLGLSEALAWTAGWSATALIGAALLNPVCALIFLGGCLLEAIYCLLWKRSPLRALVSGAVKTTGAVAAVYAVDASPNPPFVIALFLCLFFWEIGGQNVPNDWSDMQADRRAGAKTIPIVFGTVAAGQIVAISLCLATTLTFLLFPLAGGYRWHYLPAVLAVDAFLLLSPAWKLYRGPNAENAMALFNRASYFPLAMAAITLALIVS